MPQRWGGSPDAISASLPTSVFTLANIQTETLPEIDHSLSGVRNCRMMKSSISTMSSRIDKIEVSAETAQLIRNEAKKRGVSVDEYLRALADTTAAQIESELSESEVDKILDELAA